VFADLLTTVSPTYAKEIQTREYGERLEGVLQGRAQDVFGVLNGIDYREWNPATDRLLAANYDDADLTGKAKCKADLQRQLGLAESPDVPLFGLVSRLAGQKGLDLLAEALPQLLQREAQFALLGTGDRHYEELMTDLARQYPAKMAAVIGFDNALAHRIYAGCDCFVMPSHYEPCGLGQLISLRYGTLPVVRRTGGLADTITDFSPERPEGNGFSFEERSAAALLATFGRAMAAMQEPLVWSKLVQRAMACDFSWDRSAQEYARLYELARERHRS
jgi:starch synthase